jgi:hypothetical protein
LPADLQAFFRAEVLTELERKATRDDGTVDRVKLRKLFYALSETSEVIFGPQFASTKAKLDAESRAAVRKADNSVARYEEKEEPKLCPKHKSPSWNTPRSKMTVSSNRSLA